MFFFKTKEPIQDRIHSHVKKLMLRMNGVAKDIEGVNLIRSLDESTHKIYLKFEINTKGRLNLPSEGLTQLQLDTWTDKFNFLQDVLVKLEKKTLNTKVLDELTNKYPLALKGFTSMTDSFYKELMNTHQQIEAEQSDSVARRRSLSS